MNKHTPGPWVADLQTEQVYSEEGVIVYELGTNEADARLIAAAPDLLGSLEDCVSELELYANTHHPKGADGARDHMVKIMLARSAIAKARGEQS